MANPYQLKFCYTGKPVKFERIRGKDYAIDTEHGLIFVTLAEFSDVASRYTLERRTDDNGKDLFFFVRYEEKEIIGRSGRA